MPPAWSRPGGCLWPARLPPSLLPRWTRLPRSRSPSRPGRTTRPVAGTSSRARSPPSANCGWRAAGAWTRAPPPGASPTCCCAPARAMSSRWTWDTASWPGRCGPMTRVTVLDRVNVRQPAARAGGPAAGPGHRRPLVHLARPGAARPWSPARRPDADFVLMVKPQFEVGKGQVGAGGVVRDPELRAAAVAAVAAAAAGPGPRRGRGDGQPAAGPVRERGVLPLAAPRRAAAAISELAAGDRGRTAVNRPADRAASWRTPVGRAAVRTARLVVGPADLPPGSPCGSWRPRPPTCSASGARRGARPRPPRRRRRRWCMVLGGDGTLLRAAEMARPAGRPAARGQPRARRLPGRGRARRPVRRRRPGRGRATVLGRGADDRRRDGPAERHRDRARPGR